MPREIWREESLTVCSTMVTLATKAGGWTMEGELEENCITAPLILGQEHPFNAPAKIHFWCRMSQLRQLEPLKQLARLGKYDN